MRTESKSAEIGGAVDRHALAESAEGNHLVLVRGDVLDSVVHVLGNQFQRLYHLAERVRETDGVVGAELESSTTRLEQFLKLLLDYISPSQLSLQAVSLGEVIESFAQQISEIAGKAPTIVAATRQEANVLVDPGLLARAFGLLAGQFRSAARSNGTSISMEIGEAAGSAVTTVQMSRSRLQDRSAELELQWAVGERILEVHGGSLCQKSVSPGEVAWELILPLHA